MTRTKPAVVVAATAIFFGLGCASSADPGSTEADQNLLGAPEDTTHTFGVGICSGNIVDRPEQGAFGICAGPGTGRCSGTLVGPNLVLTARHCVDDTVQAAVAPAPCDRRFVAPAPDKAPKLRVTTSPSVFLGTPKWYDVAKVLKPTADDRLCSSDVALLLLATPVPNSEAYFVGVDVARRLASDPPQKLAAVGRGVEGQTYELDKAGDWTGEVTFENGKFKRRVAEHIPFRCVSNDPAAPCQVVNHEVPSTHVQTLSLEQFSLAPILGSGDSGGSLFDQLSFAQGPYAKVVGVMTWSFISETGKDSASGAARLEPHRAFILEGAAEAARLGGYAPLWWTR